jgi:membrane protein implicated in regulation of membrane protease activity
VPHWPLRPRLVIVTLLALCDYLLWNWSLSANHDVLALVSGMTLIPLILALAWLVVLAVGHLLAVVAQRSRQARARRSGVGHRVSANTQAGATGTAAGAGTPRGSRRSSKSGADEAPTASPSSKLAA